MRTKNFCIHQVLGVGIGVTISTASLSALAVPDSQVSNLDQHNQGRSHDMTHIFSSPTKAQLTQRVTNIPLAVASPSPNPRSSPAKDDPYSWLWVVAFASFGLFILWRFVINMTKGSGSQTRGNSSGDYFHIFDNSSDSDSSSSDAYSSGDGGDFGGGSSGGGGDGGDW